MIRQILVCTHSFIVLLHLACSGDFSPLAAKRIIREAADLSLLSLPADNPAYSLTRAGKTFTWENNWENHCYYLVQFKFEWRRPPDQIVNVDLTVTESYEMALDFLRSEWETSSLYLGAPRPRDYPTIAGTISYQGGRTFIRDNIIAKIRILNDSSLTYNHLAALADHLLLKAPTHSDLSHVRPSIRRFAIEKNPVPLRSSTKLDIAVVDPLKSTLYYDWRFQPNFGGIWLDKDGYYFQIDMDEPGTIFLRLIVYNQAGFSSWSEIEIVVKK
ncbi:hypothetical protein GX408_14500 [bacterium]|nr:hypothetical protein [bacterium]